jgi:hypothetical protein
VNCHQLSAECARRAKLRRANCYAIRSFGFELQGPCSAFTAWRARKRDPKTFPLAAHNQELVLRHMTLVLQHSKSALNTASVSTIASKDLFTSAGKSSASMFCHFKSSRAIVLLQRDTQPGGRDVVAPIELGGRRVVKLRAARAISNATPTLRLVSGSNLGLPKNCVMGNWSSWHNARPMSPIQAAMSVGLTCSITKRYFRPRVSIAHQQSRSSSHP